MDAQIGSYAGIVALASLAIRETFKFVQPLLVKRNGNGTYDIRWDKIVEMMSTQGQKIEKLEDAHNRNAKAIEDLVFEQRELNKYLLRQEVRDEEHKRRRDG